MINEEQQNKDLWIKLSSTLRNYIIGGREFHNKVNDPISADNLEQIFEGKKEIAEKLIQSIAKATSK